MNKQNNVGVLFTSGMDSTYLVYKNLKDGNTVQPLYIDVANNATKATIEWGKINELYDIFVDEFPGKISRPRKIISLDVHETQYNFALVQSAMWIFAINFMQYNDISEFQIAYVMNDDAISYLNELKEVYKSYSLLYKEDVTQIPLSFPLSKISKHTIITLLPKKYLNKIWFCEPQYPIETVDAKPCGTCHSCITYKNLIKENRAFDQFFKNDSQPMGLSDDRDFDELMAGPVEGYSETKNFVSIGTEEDEKI